MPEEQMQINNDEESLPSYNQNGNTLEEAGNTEAGERRKHTFLAIIGLPLTLMLVVIGSVLVMISYSLYVSSTGGSLPATEEGLLNAFLEPPILTILLVMQFAAFIFTVFVAKGLADAKSFGRFFHPSTYKGFCQKMGLPTKFDKVFWKHVLNGVLLGAIMLVLLMAFNLLLGAIGITPQSSDTSEQLGSSGSILVLMFIIPLLGPFAEELFFRGYLMSYFTDRGRPDVKVSKARAITAVAVTSILFGLMHTQGFSSFNDLFVVLWTASLGAVFAITYLKTKKITTAIVAHMVYNALSVVILVSTTGLIMFF